ncbi:MAG TPA: FtsX-like permease family protein [Nevskiaceae bacterium]|nr:FtsX-like permease family protein [Nevskiaceae bacterium]
MSLLRLALAQLAHDRLGQLLNLLLLALGVALAAFLLQLRTQFEQRLTREARGVDLVLGAKGSPLQLVLSSLYHLDVPTGNIRLSEARRWGAHPMVAEAIPLSLGDSWAGHRIVGTTPAYLRLSGATVGEGRLWRAPLEAVVGASVPLAVGARFAGAHGLSGGEAHDQGQYTVVGRLPAGLGSLDRLILTDLASVWLLHGGPAADPRAPDAAREITALLIRYATPLAAASLPQTIQRESSLQAASPAFELTRLRALVGVGVELLQALAGLLLAVAALGVFVTLYRALEARQYDLALLRAMGASRAELAGLLLFEAQILALAGGLLGLLLSHGTLALLALQSRGAIEPAAPLGAEIHLLLLVQLIAALAVILPALRAYRLPVADTLSRR